MKRPLYLFVVALRQAAEVNPEVVDALLHQLEEIQQNVRMAVKKREADTVSEWASRRTQLAIQIERQLDAQSSRYICVFVLSVV
jgi:hypothetical protein